jgi:hypothetical protein
MGTIGTRHRFGSIRISLSGVSAHARFFNFHGEVGARLNVNETVYNVSNRPASVLFHITSWLLFRAPNFHMETLRTIWVDQTINYVPWTKFLENLNSEWQELVLYVSASMLRAVSAWSTHSFDRRQSF